MCVCVRGWLGSVCCVRGWLGSVCVCVRGWARECVGEQHRQEGIKNVNAFVESPDRISVLVIGSGNLLKGLEI